MKELARNNKIGSIIITVLILFLSLFMLTSPVYAKKESKFDILLYLQCALTPDEYGGIYMEEDVYYIKPLAESRKKVEQLAAKVQKQYAIPNIVVDENVEVSIRELELTKRILDKAERQYNYHAYYNIPKNVVSVYGSNWSEDTKQEIREMAGADHISFEQLEALDGIGYGYNAVFRLDENSIEWYQASHYSNSPNFIAARYMESPIYEKNGELMIPLKDFVYSFPEDRYFKFDESKKELEISIASCYYIISVNNPNTSMNKVVMNGVKMYEENLFNGIEVRDGIVYAPAKMAYALIGHIGVFQKDIYYNPEYKTISEAY